MNQKDDENTDLTDEDFDPSMEDISEHIGFKVKARATDRNIEAHNMWKQRAWDEHDGDYTELIKADNKRAQRDWKYAALNQQIEDLQRRVSLIETNMASQSNAKDNEETDEDEGGTF